MRWNTRSVHPTLNPDRVESAADMTPTSGFCLKCGAAQDDVTGEGLRLLSGFPCRICNAANTVFTAREILARGWLGGGS